MYEFLEVLGMLALGPVAVWLWALLMLAQSDANMRRFSSEWKSMSPEEKQLTMEKARAKRDV